MGLVERIHWIGWFKGDAVFRASHVKNEHGLYYFTIWTQ